ncbi:MAG: site-2 protease family protein [Thaumarchaeota archaeon]|nr:site-2 protease family protein [Nitrososphaerota archaeon]
MSDRDRLRPDANPTPDQTADTSSIETAGGPEEPQKEEETKAVTFSWGIVMVRTKRLLYLLDRLAKYRFFGDIGWAFLGITLVAAAFMIWLMLDQDYILLTGSLALRCAVGAAPATQCTSAGIVPQGPPPLQAYLLLPGLNPLIPFVYGIIGIVIAVVIHEGTHGVIARRLGLPVKSTGVLFFLIVPIGAFVEIDEKLIQKSRFRDSGRIMAGGPGSNIIVALIALGLLLLVVGGLVPVQFDGVQVQTILSPSPAYQLLQRNLLASGDVIVAVNNTAVHSVANLSSFMKHTHPNETLIVYVQHVGVTKSYALTLAANPNNKSIGFIGIQQSFSDSDLSNIKNNYASSFFRNPLLYLVVPGVFAQASSVVPFSSQLAGLYTSPTLGFLWFPLASTFFWIWFINVNLAFFNAIPLYPLDGGQALLNFFSHFGRKGVELRAKTLTTIISIAMLILILSFLFLPRILGLLTI